MTKYIITTPTHGDVEVSIESDAVTIDDYVSKTYPGSSYREVTDTSISADIKIASLRALCAAEIVAGYTSSALGDEHKYPCRAEDQINMLGSVTDSVLPGLPDDWSTSFWCADASGNWTFASHTAAQIQKAGSDGKAHILSCQSKLDHLTKAVNAAHTVDEINAIEW